MRYIGLAAGSVSVKTVVMDSEGKILATSYKRHKGHPVTVALKQLREVISMFSAGRTSLSITGSGGKGIAEILDIPHVNEIVGQSF